MNIRTQSGPSNLVLDLTPMIDVVFLLLIFFMIATTFADPEREIELDLPEAEAAAQAESEKETLIINVLADGSVLLRGESLDTLSLDAALRRAAKQSSETEVTIRGDRLARHQAIVSVMDACGRAGLTRLAVGTTEGS